MNLFTVSVPAAIVFACYLLIVNFVLRTLAMKYNSHAWAQGLAVLVS